VTVMPAIHSAPSSTIRRIVEFFTILKYEERLRC
jgi:hypothetical protein